MCIRDSDELNKQRGIKAKFSLRNLIGQFGDVSGTTKGGDTAQAQPQQGAPGAPPQRDQTAPSGAAGQPTPQTPSAPPPGGGQQPAAPPAAPATTPPIPTRRPVFKTPEQIGQEKIAYGKQEFEQLTKPELDYMHKQRLEEIQAQYGQRLTQRMKVVGSSVPLGTDVTGKPIDPKKPYTVLYNNQNQAVAALEEYEKPSSTRATGPEAKVDSLKKDIMAEAQANGKPMDEAQAEIQARTLVLREERAKLYATLTSTKGREFSNKVKEAFESGVMTAATARGIIGYVGTEAKRRFYDDEATYRSGKSLREIEDDIYVELGTTRDQIGTYLRQGASGPKPGEPGSKTNKFDSSINPIPSRP